MTSIARDLTEAKINSHFTSIIMTKLVNFEIKNVGQIQYIIIRSVESSNHHELNNLFIRSHHLRCNKMNYWCINYLLHVNATPHDTCELTHSRFISVSFYLIMIEKYYIYLIIIFQTVYIIVIWKIIINNDVKKIFVYKAYIAISSSFYFNFYFSTFSCFVMQFWATFKILNL